VKEKEPGFARLLKKVRADLSLSQEDLARELNVSFATVNRWENNQVKPSKLARIQFESFHKRMIQTGRIAPEEQDQAKS
jgi:DNA-binding XRE family transcriptional regulator